MGYLKTNWRRAAIVFGGCTLVSFIFAAVSYAAAVGENNKEFDFVSALRLNLVQFYPWAILSPLVFRFSRRFPIELRPLNIRNLSRHGCHVCRQTYRSRPSSTGWLSRVAKIPTSSAKGRTDIASRLFRFEAQT